MALAMRNAKHLAQLSRRSEMKKEILSTIAAFAIVGLWFMALVLLAECDDSSDWQIQYSQNMPSKPYNLWQRLVFRLSQRDGVRRQAELPRACTTSCVGITTLPSTVGC